MEYNGLIKNLPAGIKIFVGVFVVVLSIGFYTGLLFVSQTGSSTPNGMETTYLGNEEDEGAKVMKFEKSEREMFTIIHTHVLSMSFIFFLMGCLVWCTGIPKNLKLFLTIEPFFSVILTFGGIFLLWKGWLWMKYVVVLSGILMTITYTASSVAVLSHLLMKSNPKN